MTDKGRCHSRSWQKRREFYRRVSKPESVPPGQLSVAKNRELKIRLYRRQFEKCAYCGVPFASVDEATIDHLIPVSRGGTDYFHNLRLACQPCNAVKGNMLPDDPEWTLPGIPRVRSTR